MKQFFSFIEINKNHFPQREIMYPQSFQLTLLNENENLAKISEKKKRNNCSAMILLFAKSAIRNHEVGNREKV